ncbi:MAG: hypothetical protein N3A66_02470 [Planctomycetota bacterium]|nr:hypothetical protein [Planctomycetota bacterium]
MSDAVSPPAPSESASTSAPANEEKKDERDLLKTSPEEAKELEALIERGYRAHNRAGFFSFLSLTLVVLAVAFYKFDWLPTDQTEGRTFRDHLHILVRNHEEERLYAKNAAVVPRYPEVIYARLRQEAFLVAGLALLLALAMLHAEKARIDREHLLMFRALAREIEKLRLRLKLEEGGREKKAPKASTPEETK